MFIKFFNKEKHYDIVLEWWKKTNTDPQSELPLTGVIVFNNNGEGLAAGWMIKTEMRYCIFENFIANPKADRKERNKAIDMLIDALEAVANKEGFKIVVAFPKIKQLIRRSVKHGYEVLRDPIFMISKEIA